MNTTTTTNETATTTTTPAQATTTAHDANMLDVNFLRAAKAAGRLSPALAAVLEAMESGAAPAQAAQAAQPKQKPVLHDGSFNNSKSGAKILGFNVHIPGRSGKSPWLSSDHLLAILDNAEEFRREHDRINALPVEQRTSTMPAPEYVATSAPKSTAPPKNSRAGKRNAKEATRKAKPKQAKVDLELLKDLRAQGLRGEELRQAMRDLTDE